MEFLEPITLAAPHIYLSALPFAPQKSKISMHFLELFPKTLTVKMGQMEHWSEKCFLRLADHAGGVTSVAFSPDGRYIVSGSYDKIGLIQLHFLLMADTLFLDLMMRQLECGMLTQVRVLWVLSKAIIIGLLQLHFLLMADTLYLDLMIGQSESGMLRQVRVLWIL
jgi:hypothetical protein